MNTKIFTNSHENIKAAAEIIKAGGLVAFPTETVYGLGANALDEAAVKKIYETKGRPGDNPMIVHIAKALDIGQLVTKLNQVTLDLIENFWPGPLTLVLNKKDEVPYVTTGGMDTVAVRMPDDLTALALITQAGCPIAAPSANISGRPSPTGAMHVIEDLDGKIDAIIVGKDCRIGIESTVLDVTGDIPVILRPGVITASEISRAIDCEVELDPWLFRNDMQDEDGNEAHDFNPKSPGMKYKHYAPKAQMKIIEGERSKVKSEIERLKSINESKGNSVGVILFEEKAFMEAAHDLFAKLREFDRQGVDIILAGALSDKDEVGFAVMNRMLKSAGYNIIKV